MRHFDATAYRSGVAAEVHDDLLGGRHTELAEAVGLRLTRRFGRTALFATVALAEALHEAGIEVGELAAAGLALGGSTAGMVEAEEALLGAAEGEDPWLRATPTVLLTTPVASTSDILARALGIRGPQSFVSTACSSATNAIGLGARWIRSGRLDRVIVGGADSLCRLTLAGFNSLGVVDPERPRPFDARRKGMVIGEGAGMFVLESEDLARARGARIRGRILGFGNVGEAYHPVQPREDGLGAARAMSMALSDARLRPEDIDYVNAHGTATPQNDVMEVRAVHSVFGDRARAAELPVSSTKSQVGHTLGASGAVELAAVLLGLERGFLPPTAGYEEPDEDIVVDPIPGQARGATTRCALSNAFAFGGNDSTLCVGAAEVSP